MVDDRKSEAEGASAQKRREAALKVFQEHPGLVPAESKMLLIGAP